MGPRERVKARHKESSLFLCCHKRQFDSGVQGSCHRIVLACQIQPTPDDSFPRTIFPAQRGKGRKQKKYFISVRSLPALVFGERQLEFRFHLEVTSENWTCFISLLSPSTSTVAPSTANGHCSPKLKSTSGAPQIRTRLETWIVEEKREPRRTTSLSPIEPLKRPITS